LKTNIFYFSGIGNCLQIARELGQKLEDTEIIFIPKVISGEINLAADRIGFVFPQYHCVPLNIVKKSLE